MMQEMSMPRMTDALTLWWLRMTRDGVLVEFPKPVNLNGVLKPIHLISLEQAGNAVGVDAAVRSQDQLEADAVDLENISRARVRTYNNTFAGKAFTIDGKAYSCMWTLPSRCTSARR